jgi:hypothetical protein
VRTTTGHLLPVGFEMDASRRLVFFHSRTSVSVSPGFAIPWETLSRGKTGVVIRVAYRFITINTTRVNPGCIFILFTDSIDDQHDNYR